VVFAGEYVLLWEVDSGLYEDELTLYWFSIVDGIFDCISPYRHYLSI
jgi:nitrogen fixation-related uncharacterized protein